MQPQADDDIFNPSELEEDAFLAGPERYAQHERGKTEVLLDIDDVFGKSLERVLADHSPSSLDFGSAVTPSVMQRGYTFCEIESGVVLRDPAGRLAGAYIGTDLAVSPDHRGLGLGAELVLEYAMRNGCLPNWWLDAAAYSHAGEAAHRAAWRMSLDERMFSCKAASLRAARMQAELTYDPRSERVFS